MTPTIGNGSTVPKLALLLGGVAAVYGYGVAGYMLFGFGFIDAAYMTALALTTAGFNPVGALTPGEKAFTIFQSRT